MKDLQKYLIVAILALCLGFVAQSIMGITMRKAANSRFVDESTFELRSLRATILRFKQKESRFPSSVGELYAKGYLDPSKPPYESMRHSGRWTREWDGEGGFVYESSTGQVYLNADVSREKFFSDDWKRVKDGGMFPPGKIY